MFFENQTHCEEECCSIWRDLELILLRLFILSYLSFSGKLSCLFKNFGHHFYSAVQGESLVHLLTSLFEAAHVNEVLVVVFGESIQVALGSHQHTGYLSTHDVIATIFPAQHTVHCIPKIPQKHFFEIFGALLSQNGFYHRC